MRLTLLVFFAFCTGLSLHASAAPSCDEEALGRTTLSAQFDAYQGTPILLLSGEVDSAAHQRVRSYIRRTGAYSEVWLCSGGGVVSEGIKIGRELQRARAKVRIPDDYLCASSCTIMTLGGYLRIIEEGAEFIVHASSRHSRIGDQVFFKVKCSSSRIPQACSRVLEQFASQGLTNCSPEEFGEAAPTCNFGIGQNIPNGQKVLFIRTDQLTKWHPSQQTLEIMLESQLETFDEFCFNLLKYYQEMLLDGQTSLIDHNVYSRLFREFNSQPMFNRGNTERLNLSATASALGSTNDVIEERVIWQEVLTQTELTIQDQLINFMRLHAGELGPAGAEALDIYEATLTCRIQAACYLAGHQSAALGYHNYNEDD